MLNVLNKVLKFELQLPILTLVRHKHRYRRRIPIKIEEIDPWEGKSLETVLAEKNKTDPEIDFKVDIGLPPPPSLSKKVLTERLNFYLQRKADPELEKQARNLTLEVDLDLIKEEWKKTDAPKHIKMAAEHYNIFQDLFGDAYFLPYVIMDIYYPQDDENLVAPVCRGNVVKPGEAFHEPTVKFQSKPDELWTLTLVSLDGHLTEDNMEYIHWFVGNIPGGDVSKGEVYWDYLPPFPPRGFGFQRFAFVLYKQEGKVDYSRFKKQLPCLELKDRSFKNLEFYRETQDLITPAGLSFFQTDWDKTSRKVFHEILNMEEPVFEYDFPPKYMNSARWFPKRLPFDMYLDKYRDQRDINAEYLKRKLLESNPFSPPKKPFPYPKAISQYFKGMPSWLARKERYYRLGMGKVSHLERDEYE